MTLDEILQAIQRYKTRQRSQQDSQVRRLWKRTTLVRSRQRKRNAVGQPPFIDATAVRGSQASTVHVVSEPTPIKGGKGKSWQERTR